MPYYKKRPVTIEAWQWDGTPNGAGPIINWALRYAETITFHCDSEEDCAKGNHYLRIITKEGPMKASPGDFVIRGVQDEFYACKPDIFADTYLWVSSGEPVKDDAPRHDTVYVPRNSGNS